MTQEKQESFLNTAYFSTIFEKRFICLSAIFIFFLCLESSIVKASSSSLFLTIYSSQMLPWAWFFGVFVNYMVVFLYNRFLPIFGCQKVLIATLSIEVLLVTTSSLLMYWVCFLPFILYLCKDIFVLLFFQQIWSMIHATISTTKAKIIYSYFFGLGGLGSLFGGCITTNLAGVIGSKNLLFLCIPCLLMMGLSFSIALFMRERIGMKQDLIFQKKRMDIFHGLRFIAKSKVLQLIFYMVFILQLGSTLLDYQFSLFLESRFPIQDLRTAFLGKFFGIVNIYSIIMQFAGGVFIRRIGLKSVLLSISGILTTFSLICFLWCNFFVLSLFYGNAKCFDYSLFNLSKEMMYIPMRIDDKFHGKAVIDVFVYRLGKVCASLVILCAGNITCFFPIALNTWMLGLTTCLFFIWFIAILIMFKHYDLELRQGHWIGAFVE